MSALQNVIAAGQYQRLLAWIEFLEVFASLQPVTGTPWLEEQLPLPFLTFITTIFTLTLLHACTEARSHGPDLAARYIYWETR